MAAWKRVASYVGTVLVLAFVGLVYWSAPAEREEICSVRLESNTAGEQPATLAITATLRNGDSGLRGDHCTRPADPPGPVEVLWRQGDGDWRTLVMDEDARAHTESGTWHVEVAAPACGPIELELRVHHDEGGWMLAHDTVEAPC